MQNILVLGGGHGLNAVVEALKKENDYHIKALVSTADSGGHTGLIRDEFSVPAVGDIRKNLAETLDNYPLIKEMMEYRFDTLHGTKNVSLGNLMVLSLLKHYSLEEVLFKFHQKFETNVLIMPLYNEPIDLCAKYTDGTIGKKEHLIPCDSKIIEDVFYNEKKSISNKICKAIKDANVIIIGPGSLYTSIGAVLADDKVASLVNKSKAKIIYICNIMTEPNETDNYDILNHVEFIERKIRKSIDYIIANKNELNEKQKKKYADKQSFVVLKNEDKRIIYDDLVDLKQEYVRHDTKKLKKLLRQIIDN